MPKPAQKQRHNPLSESYIPKETVRPSRDKKRKSETPSVDGDGYVDAHASRKILKIGRDLADEDEAERKPKYAVPAATAFEFESRFVDEQEGEEVPGEFDDNDEAWGDEDEEVEEVEVDPDDLAAFQRFNPNSGGDDPIKWPGMSGEEEEEGEGTNLTDLILKKIAMHEAGQPQEEDLMEPVDEPVELPEKVVEVYKQVGLILSRYKSGPLPKPFKVLPGLPPPQQAPLVGLTRPDSWTPNATYEATRLFISRSPPTAQAFCSEILLPAVQSDIHETRKLNVHLYKALKKALYKPAAFFKGLVFPLLLEGCTLREAQIISSVVARVSIPVLHSAAALQRICEIAADQMGGREGVNGAVAANLFIRVLLEKKYALPYKVIDAVVFHFLRFRAVPSGMDVDGASGKGQNSEESLPVIWHQSLLAFAQRYRNDLTEDQREALLDLVNHRGHRQIGPEVRRELLAGRGRGVQEEPKNDSMMGGDDTMAGVTLTGVA